MAEVPEMEQVRETPEVPEIPGENPTGTQGKENVRGTEIGEIGIGMVVGGEMRSMVLARGIMKEMGMMIQGSRDGIDATHLIGHAPNKHARQRFIRFVGGYLRLSVLRRFFDIYFPPASSVDARVSQQTINEQKATRKPCPAYPKVKTKVLQHLTYPTKISVQPAKLGSRPRPQHNSRSQPSVS